MAETGVAYLTPEAKARLNIDAKLTAAGWAVQDARSANLTAAKGVTVREFVLKPPHGRADYLLFVDRQPVGVLEAKKEGETLTGVAWQTSKYIDGIPDDIEPALEGALPFVYQSTGIETRFTNTLDPEPTSRDVFSFHRPETLAGWIDEVRRHPTEPTLRHRLHTLPSSGPQEPLAGADARDPKPGEVACGESATRADPDGYGRRQDIHGREHCVSTDQVRRCPAHPLPRRPRESRAADSEGVPGFTSTSTGSARK